ncbi:MAG: CpaF family protein, partial [Promicromonosporaceae bacterium]|nr:CpaF family protein [Promicromonosporaceae bacterium]
MTTTTSAQQVLTAEVRELVRSRGIDPLRERREFDRLIASALGDYNERAHRGQVPALADAPACVRAITDLLAGFGPLQRYLDADDVEELWINGPTEVWVARGGRPELTTVVLAPGEVEALVERMLKVGGRR